MCHSACKMTGVLQHREPERRRKQRKCERGCAAAVRAQLLSICKGAHPLRAADAADDRSLTARTETLLDSSDRIHATLLKQRLV